MVLEIYIFGLCRFANQLGADITETFNEVKKEIFSKYSGGVQKRTSLTQKYFHNKSLD